MKINTLIRKRFRIKNKLKKVSKLDRFRLSVSRSSKNISAQIIDDNKNVTLLSVSSVEKDIKSLKKVNKTEVSKVVAEKLAKKAHEKKITNTTTQVKTNTKARTALNMRAATTTLQKKKQYQQTQQNQQ